MAPNRKLQRLLKGAYANVPFYQRLYNGLGINREDVQGHEVLYNLPILTKADLLAASIEERTDKRFDASTLAHESTTGTTGQPFTLCVDAAYKRRRNFRFLRALLEVGYRPWTRLMLLTDRYSAPTTRVGNRYYVSVEQSTADIRTAFFNIRPQILYGFKTPLRLLAQQIESDVSPEFSLSAVVSTGEILDEKADSFLQTVYGCPVHDLYGMTETGLIARRQSSAPVYRLFDSSVITEFLPVPGNDKLFKLVVTNLDLRCSPIIRYDSGDLVSLTVENGVKRIVSILGRQVDTLRSIDGSEISPYRVTDALRDVPGLRQFKVTQTKLDNVDVDLEVTSEHQSVATDRVHEILGQLLGTGMNINVNFHEKLVRDGARKFRSIESTMAAEERVTSQLPSDDTRATT